ncbi:MAG: ArgE/DapE family deacylase [Acidobacteria bacterium]|nr:MAG: ArgE/DapE family deacylase [Acidobacteriota bacterium]GIK76380.1 MAG: acetylornithine deacetylase [Actinomycetes bacterium]
MRDERRVLRAIEERADDLVALAAELIRFDTTTRGEPGEPARDEEPLQRRLAAILEAAGAEVELWEPAPGELDRWPRQVPPGLTFAGRPQLLARFRGGDREAPSLLLNGHVDVVSAEPRSRWASAPFEPEVRDGRLYGRGACDMKGGVAAMVLAVEVLATEDALPAGELLVNTVTDEEWNGAGSLAAAAHGVSADAGVIPEATDFEPWIACRGVVNPTVTVRGRPGHAEMPQPDWREGGAVNAIEKAVIVLEAVRELRESWAREGSGHPLLVPGELIPTVIEGGEWWVNYPASCTVVVDVTYLPRQGDADGGWAAGLEREIEDWIGAAARRDPWLAENPPAFEWGTNLAPAEVPADHPVVAAALAAGATVDRPGRVAALQGWHDAATFTRFGTPTISYGPSGLSNDGETMAHAIDEYVPVGDLVATAQALALIAMRWGAR